MAVIPIPVNQIFYPSDRQGTLLLSDDQVTAADEILRVTINGEIYDRVIDGGIRAAHISVYPSGSDQTGNLNTAFGKDVVKQVIFDEPGTNEYVIDGTVTIPNDVVITISGANSFTGTGTINGGIWDIDDVSQIWDTGLTVNPYNFARGYIPPYAWGFIPDTGTDMSATFQKVINWAINSGTTRKIYVSNIGVYNVNNIVIAKYIAGQAQACTLSILGAINSTSQGVVFYNTNKDGATVHMQVANGVDIDNIVFRGIGPEIGNFITAEDAQWAASTFGGGVTLRTHRKSPNCAISIDNFYAIGAAGSTITSTGDYYPGMDVWYTNFSYAGSTNINITNCTFDRIFVGICEGVSGAPNGEGIRIQGGFGVFVAYTWVAGQLQSRENTINNFYFIFGHTFITNLNWGTGIGDVPSVNNCNINYLKYITTTTGNFTIPRFSTGYSEGIWSIGYNGSATPIIFDKWNLTLCPTTGIIPGVTTGMAPLLLETSGPFYFSNGQFQAGNYYSGLPFKALAIYFTNTRIEAGFPFNANAATFFDNIKFYNVSFFGAGANIRLDEGRNESAFDSGIFGNRNETFILAGGKITDITYRTFENIGRKFDLIPVNQSFFVGNAVTVNSTTQTLTFTATDGGLFQGGDVIFTTDTVDYTNDLYTGGATTLGYVAAVVGNVVTLSNIPYGVVNGATYMMFILRIPRLVNHTLGTLIAGNNTITNVINDTGGFAIGDRIKGIGITNGTYVTNVVGNTIYISTNATANGSLVQLSDAKIKVTADDTSFIYFGGNYNYNILEVIWFVGDELRNVTTGVQTLGRYCTVQGKVSSGTPPTWLEVTTRPTLVSQLENDLNYLRVNVIKLTGTEFGSVGFDPSTLYPMAFDGDINTAYGSGSLLNYVGIATADTYILTKIRVVPRYGLADRLLNRLIQGSNESETTGYEHIFAIPILIPNAVYTEFSILSSKPYKFFRLCGLTGVDYTMDVAEIEFYGYQSNVLSLTTTGSSGAATLVDSVLNIPNYSYSELSEYANNADALANGLVVGDRYRTGDLLKITH